MIRLAFRGHAAGAAVAHLGLEVPPGVWTAERSYAFCDAIVRSHEENFPVASLLVPRRLRPHMAAIYAFARTADDFADEPQYEGRRAAALDYWEEELQRCSHGEASHPVFVAL